MPENNRDFTVSHPISKYVIFEYGSLSRIEFILAGRRKSEMYLGEQ